MVWCGISMNHETDLVILPPPPLGLTTVHYINDDWAVISSRCRMMHALMRFLLGSKQLELLLHPSQTSILLSMYGK